MDGGKVGWEGIWGPVREVECVAWCVEVTGKRAENQQRFTENDRITYSEY